MLRQVPKTGNARSIKERNRVLKSRRSKLPPLPQKPVRTTVHNPRMDTILMVEDAIRGNRTFDSKSRLLKSLATSMQYGTFLRILKYLQDSNKIVIEKDGTIIWTFVDTPAAIQSLKDSKPLI